MMALGQRIRIFQSLKRLVVWVVRQIQLFEYQWADQSELNSILASIDLSFDVFEQQYFIVDFILIDAPCPPFSPSSKIKSIAICFCLLNF